MRGILGVLLVGLWCSAAAAQAPEVIYCRRPVFNIPFTIDPGELPRLVESQLWVATEKDRAWKQHKSVKPDQRSFPFRADRDGLYYFLVRTVDKEGRAFPPSLEQATPGLRVCVDTVLPVVNVRALPPKQDQLGFAWEIREDHVDLATLAAEFRGANGEWQPLTVEGVAVGQRYFNPGVRGTVEVRLRVRDKAENQGSAQVTLGQGAGVAELGRRDNLTNAGIAGLNNSPPRPTPTPGSSALNPKVVNSVELSLNYSLEEVGPSGVSVVEIWTTKDGRSWQKLAEDEDKTSPFNLKLPGEGLFGLTLVVKSGVGLGDRTPQPGDAPQMWLEVDLTKPTVTLGQVEPTKGVEGNVLTVTWKAEDKNLPPQPITILYAETMEGPWQPIVSSLENLGRYVWRIPAATPYKFFVRIEALDKGGNVGRAETTKQVVVDLSLPKGKLLGVDGK